MRSHIFQPLLAKAAPCNDQIVIANIASASRQRSRPHLPPHGWLKIGALCDVMPQHRQESKVSRNSIHHKDYRKILERKTSTPRHPTPITGTPS